jgi:hypothetical protein
MIILHLILEEVGAELVSPERLEVLQLIEEKVEMECRFQQHLEIQQQHLVQELVL